MDKQLRCYFAGSRSMYADVPYVDACFAYSSRDARALFWRSGCEIKGECDGQFFDMRVSYKPEHNHLAEKYGITEPKCVNADDILREMGWSIEGDAHCGHCNLAEFDGQYPVCEHCFNCSECGHTADCPEHSTHH